MSTPITHPGAVTSPGSPTAKASAAAAVIALAAAVAGSALLAGIATGSAIEAPGDPVVTVTTPAEPATPPITNGFSEGTGGGLTIPLRAN